MHVLLDQCSEIASTEHCRSGDPYAVTQMERNCLAACTASIEAEEQLLLPLLRHLQTTMTRIRKQRTINDAYMSSVRRIPREILSEIFLIAVALADNKRDSERYGSVYPNRKYNFAKVCRIWRAVALDTTALWTSIFLPPFESTRPWTNFGYRLQRTKKQPLDVRLAGRTGGSSSAWDLLLQESYRWRTLVVDDMACLDSESVAQPIALPTLETFTAKVDIVTGIDDVDAQGEFCRVFDNLGEAPQLRHVELDFVDICGPAKLRFPPIWQLTHLELRLHYCDRPNSLLPMIRQMAPTLRKLSVNVLDCEQFLRDHNAVLIHVPNLQSLSCTGMACFLFQHFAPPPQLTHLRIESYMDHHFLRSGVERISTYEALTELELVDVVWRAESLLSTFRCMPRLATLKIAETSADFVSQCMSGTVLAGLTRGGVDVHGAPTSPNPSCPLPNLTRMYIQLYSCETAKKAAAITSMALSRKVGGISDGVTFRPLDVFDFGLHDSIMLAATGDIPCWAT